MNFKKLFKLKRELTHGEKLEGARNKGDAALSLFTTAHTQLDEANSELNAIFEDARAKANELLKHADAAQNEIRMNLSVQSRLKSFIS